MSMSMTSVMMWRRSAWRPTVRQHTMTPSEHGLCQLEWPEGNPTQSCVLCGSSASLPVTGRPHCQPFQDRVFMSDNLSARHNIAACVAVCARIGPSHTCLTFGLRSVRLVLSLPFALTSDT
jgi:hypothetical protein